MKKSGVAINLTIIVLALLFFPLLILKILVNEQVTAYTLTYLSAKPYEIFDSLVNYLSMGFTILLGVVVYYQAQKINDLESTQYDLFVGVDKLEYSYAFDNTLIKLSPSSSSKSDFYIVQNFSKERKNYLANLNVKLHEKETPIFLPLSFITKNQLIITSIDFKKIHLTIFTEDAQKYQQDFSNSAEPLHGIFQDNSNFLFGIGFMVPISFAIDKICLKMDVATNDQVGRSYMCEVYVTLKNVSNFYYLESSKSKTRRIL